MDGLNMIEVVEASYEKAIDDEFWYCKVHHRKATHLMKRPDGRTSRRCDPSLGGIMIPCDCVKPE